MKELSLLLSMGCLSLGAAMVASAQEGEEGATVEPSQGASTAPPTGCFPDCRKGYVCHPNTQDCVSICNPPCASWEVCSAEADCISDGRASAKPTGEVGDLRFRLVLLGRFGFGGTAKVNYTDPFGSGDTSIEGVPGATLGFDLRFEKPVAKYVTVGGLISNYWLRPKKTSDSTIDIRAINPNDYALDVSPFVKPRYPFRAGNHEAEAYLLVYVGGSLRLNEFYDGVYLAPKTRAYGGFNFGIGPGFQVFVADSVALVFEVGYAYSWFKLTDGVLQSTRVGQATLRVGLAFAF